MGRKIQRLDETVEVGDEFAPWGKETSGRRVRIIRKIYNPDMSLSYRIEQTAGSGRMQFTTIRHDTLRRTYKRIQKTKRTLYRVKTREIFAGLEEINGTP